MRAVSISSFGGVEVLEVSDVPVPLPAPHQVQVRVRAAAVHPADLFARAGMFAGVVAARDRYFLGWDFAGEITCLGSQVGSFRLGDHVVGTTDWLVDLIGTQAEYVAVEADKVALAPFEMPAAAAAALPVNGLTAAQALDLLKVEPGSSVAVIGAAGGVGRLALELAVHCGADAVGVARPEDEPAIIARGARFAPRSDNLVASLASLGLAGVDSVLDTAVLGAPAVAAVRDGGRYVGVLPPYAPASERGVVVKTVGVRSNGRQLAGLVELVDRGFLTLDVAARYDLSNVALAHEHLAGGGVRGAVVLEP